MSVTKSDLIRAVRTELKITPQEARVIVDAIFHEIVTAVLSGEKVELRGIGTFRKKASPERWGRDFRSRQPVRLPAGVRISYKVSRKLRTLLKTAQVLSTS